MYIYIYISEDFNAKFRCLFGIVWFGGFVYYKNTSSSITETILDAILFCSEVNSAGHSVIEEPIRLRKKHYSPARYILKVYIKWIDVCLYNCM